MTKVLVSLSDEFLKEIVEEYRGYMALPGRYRPNQLLANAHGVGLPRAYSWIKAARYRGFLEEHTRRRCKSCGRYLHGLPPTIGHHHSASKKRMRDNALLLEARCRLLSRQASAEKRRDEAMVLRQAAYHYRTIARLFAEQ